MKCILCGKSDWLGFFRFERRNWAPLAMVRAHLRCVEDDMHAQLEGQDKPMVVTGVFPPTWDPDHSRFCAKLAHRMMSGGLRVAAETLLDGLVGQQVNIGSVDECFPMGIRCHAACWQKYERRVVAMLRNAAFKLVPLQRKIAEMNMP